MATLRVETRVETRVRCQAGLTKTVGEPSVQIVHLPVEIVHREQSPEGTSRQVVRLEPEAAVPLRHAW